MEGFDRLLEAAQRGDEEALTIIYRGTHPRILRYLRSREASLAEDVASETWLDIAAGLPSFDGDEDGFRAWAFTIARRRLADLRRRQMRRPTTPLDEVLIERRGPRGDVEEEALERLGVDDAVELVRRLPDEQADILLLRVLAQLSVERVAEIVGKRPGTVRVIQHRALRRLAREMDRRGVTR
jgi:RNA polymerase sigma-70 factor (ECF subfamily)